MATINKTFNTAEAAMSWLYDNSGLWAGISHEVQEDLLSDLDYGLPVTWLTPDGDRLVAQVQS